MELKNYFAQSSQGAALPGATCYLYQPGTEVLAEGLVDAAQAPLSNPFVAGDDGLIQFAAPNGRYDLRVVQGGRDYRVRVQCNDVNDAIAAATEEVATIKAEIRNRYYGPLSEDPVTRPDGTDMEEGDEYHNTVDRSRRVFVQGVWTAFLGASTADLANATDPLKGAGMNGYDGGTVRDVLDNAKALADYGALRAYTGRAIGIRLTKVGLTGSFYRDDADIASADNGGTIIIDGLGWRWKRQFSGPINVAWFGAVGDGALGASATNNLEPLTRAIAAAGNNLLVASVDNAGGDYAVTSGTLTIPSGVRIMLEGGARIYGQSGGVVTNNGRFFAVMGGGVGEYRADTLTKGLSTEINEPLTGVGASSTYMINRIFIADDRLDATNDGTAGSKVDGLLVEHRFGGVGASGGRHAGEFYLSQKAPTEPGDETVDRHYVGVIGKCDTNGGDGGGVDDVLGAYFGANMYVTIRNAPYVFHANGCESNVHIRDEVSNVQYRSGYSAASGGLKQGTLYDCAYSIGALGLGVADGNIAPWRHGILVGPQNGRNDPISDAVIRIEEGTTPIPAFFSAAALPAHIVQDDLGLFDFTPTMLAMYGNNANIKLGSKAASNTPYINFLSGATAAPNYDVRIIASGGSGSDGQGTLVINAATLAVSGVSRPSTDNVYSPVLPPRGGLRYTPELRPSTHLTSEKSSRSVRFRMPCLMPGRPSGTRSSSSTMRLREKVRAPDGISV